MRGYQTARDRPDHFSWQLQEMFKVLQSAKDFDLERLARLEWTFLPIFERHEFAPMALQKELARSPVFFAEIVALVYRAEDDEEKVEATDQERARAERGYDLLQSWGILPGVNEAGEIGGSAIARWVHEARAALAEKGRQKVGEQHIGVILSYSPQGSDGAWPHEDVREIIESTCSEEIERGIELGVYNRRGGSHESSWKAASRSARSLNSLATTALRSQPGGHEPPLCFAGSQRGTSETPHAKIKPQN